jgi:sporulation integral membrane protein YtvI
VSQEEKKKFIVNVAFVAVILALAWFVVKYLVAWLMPFLIGLLLALILQRPVNWVLHHSSLERKLVAPVVTFAMLAVVAVVVSMLAVRAVNELAAFIISLPGWFQTMAPSVIHAVNVRFETIIEALPDEWEASIRQMVISVVQMAQGELGRLSAAMVTWVANKAAILPGLLISLIITLVSTFFICSEFDVIREFFRRQIPERYQGLAGDTWLTFGRTLGQMLRSYLFIMFITFCELAIGFTVLRLDYAVVLAGLVSLVDILPVLGTGTILIPWGLIALLLGQWGQGVGILLLYGVVTVIRNILEPRIIGKRIGLHPLVTLIFMYLGLHIMGLPGMFLFPLIFILLKNAQEAGMIHLWKE